MSAFTGALAGTTLPPRINAGAGIAADITNGVLNVRLNDANLVQSTPVNNWRVPAFDPATGTYRKIDVGEIQSGMNALIAGTAISGSYVSQTLTVNLDVGKLTDTAVVSTLRLPAFNPATSAHSRVSVGDIIAAIQSSLAPLFEFRAQAIASSIPAPVQQVTLLGRASIFDGGGGVYRKLGAAPSPARSWHFQSADGAWWQLVASPVNVYQTGAVGNGVANDLTAIQDALDYAAAFDTRCHVPRGVYACPSGTLSGASGVIMFGDGDTSVIRRTSNAVVPLLRSAAGAVNFVVRDLRLDSTAGWGSTTSNSVGTGSRTFTVAAGLDVIVGNSVMITASPASNAMNYMVGDITAYTGTSMTVNVTTAIGSGTFADWRFDRFNENNTALSLEGAQNSDAENIIVTGRFYVGIRSMNSNSDSITNCDISGVVNRPIYVYATTGTTDGVRVTGNRIRGGGFAQYGINLNGSGGSIENVAISDNIIDNTVFQAVEIGGSVQHVTVDGNHIDTVAATSGVGVLVQRANSVQPSRVTVTGNVIKLAGGTGVLILDATLNTVSANTVASCGVGIRCDQVVSGGGVSNQYNNIIANNVSNSASHGIWFTAANVNLCGDHACSGNVLVANGGNGIASNANTTRIAFTGNVATANTGGAYNTLGTAHASAGNV